jgi:PAS domain S-box-containing protein
MHEILADFLTSFDSTDLPTRERNLLRAVIDILPEPIYVKDRQGRFIINNVADARSMGHQPAEVIGKTDFDLYPHDLAQQYWADDQHVLETGEALVNREEQVLNPAGELHWYSTSKYALRNTAGEIIGLVGISRDITERRQHELTLRQHQQEQQIILDTISSLIWYIKPDGEVIRANRAAAAVIGKSLDEVVGHSIYELYPNDAERFQAENAEIVNTRMPLRGLVGWSGKPSQDEAAYMIDKVPYINEDGILEGIVTVGANVTELLRKERELQQQREQQQIILNAIHSPIWYVDLEGRILAANRAALQEGNEAPSAVMGQNIMAVFPDAASIIRKEMDEVIRTRNTVVSIATRSKSDGRTFLVTKTPCFASQNGELNSIVISGTEVTALQLTESALREAENRYRLLIQNIPDILVTLYDGYGRIKLSDGPGLRDLHIPVEDTLNKQVTEIIPGAYGQMLQDYVHRCLAGESSSLESQSPLNNLWYEISFIPIRNTAGQVTSAMSVARNITLWKHAQNALVENEARYRLLAQNIPDSVVSVFDSSLQFVVVESSTTDTPAIEPYPIIGKRPTEYFTEPYGEQFEQLMRATLEGSGKTIQFQNDIAGQYFETAFIPLLSIEGTIKDGLIVSRNITEQKRAQIALQERLDRIDFMRNTAATFVNVASDAFDQEVTDALEIVTQFARVERGYVFLLTLDEQYLELAYEWCQTGVIGHKGILDRVSVADFADFVASMKRGEIAKVQAADIPRTPENEAMNHVLGLLEIKSFINIPILADDVFLGWIGFDATLQPTEWSTEIIDLFSFTGQIIAGALSRKRANDSLSQLNRELEIRVAERTRQLSATNKELEAFAYSVSHDLRAPLRAIDGFSQALLEDYESKLDDEGKDYLSRVRDATQRMSRLIDAMLQLSRLTRRDLRRESVNLSEIAAVITQELRKANPERIATFVIQPAMTTYTDATLMRVVLDNLLGNAWKYTSHHNHARIEFGQIEKEGQVMYFIRDDGAGFDPAYAERLFGTFQRLHHEQQFEGLGIGLATVMRIITRHGGTIWAEGAVEKGATFWFTLSASSES